jgi:LPXTG-site transpeptidase (sortase) family protein
MVQGNEPGGPGWRKYLNDRRALPILGGVAALIVLVVVIVLVVSGGGGKNDSLHAGLATAEPPAEATIDLNRQVIAEPKNLNLSKLGPDDRMMIPKISVDAPLTLKTVANDGQMPDPDGPDDIAYYDFSVWEGLGGAPGVGGNGVFAGHIDSGKKACKNGTKKPPCEAVLWDMPKLKPGDEIQVRISGQTYKYQVKTNESVNAASAPWDQIVQSTAEETITVITCIGEFKAGEYNKRQVLTAVKV